MTIRNLISKNLVALLAIIVLSCVTPAEAALIRYALIDIQPDGARLEIAPTAGIGISETLTPNNNANGPEISAAPLTSDTGDAFTISIDDTNSSGGDDGRIDWRDRGNSTSTDPLVRLAEDFVKNNGGIVRITLGDLPAGDYEVTSYHVDPSFNQADQIDVLVSTDGGATFGGVLDSGNSNFNNGGVNGLTESDILASAAMFSFTATGADDVVIVFDGNGGGADDETPLNGLDIFVNVNVVPEPSTFALTALGLLSLGFVGWRRRRR